MYGNTHSYVLSTGNWGGSLMVVVSDSHLDHSDLSPTWFRKMGYTTGVSQTWPASATSRFIECHSMCYHINVKMHVRQVFVITVVHCVPLAGLITWSLAGPQPPIESKCT